MAPAVPSAAMPLPHRAIYAREASVSDASLRAAVLGVGIPLAVVCTCLLVIRLKTHAHLKRGLWIDDICCVIALALAIGYTGNIIFLLSILRDTWDETLRYEAPSDSKGIFVMNLLYGPMMFFAKASILLLYLRAFNPKAVIRGVVYVALVLLFINGFVGDIFDLIYCMPHAGEAWGRTITRKCAAFERVGLAQTGINVAADATILIAPLPIVLRLHMSMKGRLAVAAVFATGILALIASILNLYYRKMLQNNYTVPWMSAQTYICAEAEAYASICVACMPSLAHFWKHTIKEAKVYGNLRSRFRGSEVEPGQSSKTHTWISKSSVTETYSAYGLHDSSRALHGNEPGRHSTSSLASYHLELRDVGGIARDVETDLSVPHKVRLGPG